MGCDIWVYTEYKTKNKGWKSADHFFIDEFKINKDYKLEDVQIDIVPIYDERNYRLFSVLADVRNSENQPFICQPRGIPQDASDLIKYYDNKDSMWTHSHSWLTLRELLEFKKNHVYTHEDGFETVSMFKLKHMLDTKRHIGLITAVKSPLDDLIDAMKQRLLDVYFLNYFNKEEQEEEIQKRADNFRIIFWFDN